MQENNGGKRLDLEEINHGFEFPDLKPINEHESIDQKNQNRKSREDG